MHPRWLATVATRRPRFVNVERELGPGRDVNAFVGHGMFDPSFCWDDVKRFRDLWPRKLLLKGVLRADDAERALAAGCDGIVLSNHGGRQLDGAVERPRRAARSRARRRRARRHPGRRRRAARLRHRQGGGARRRGRAARPRARLRPRGRRRDGVAHALGILADEFDRTLALTGCPDVASLTPDLVARA